jgi:purine-binding chemotaxis protein CheW
MSPDLDARQAARRLFLVARVAGIACALPVERVHEIVRVPAIFRVPGAAPHVLGLVNLRGRIVPALDPAPRLDRDGGERGARARLVVTEHGSEWVALLVDEVLDLARVPAAELTLGPADHELRSVRGAFARRGEQVLVLDLDTLVAPTRGGAS